IAELKKQFYQEYSCKEQEHRGLMEDLQKKMTEEQNQLQSKIVAVERICEEERAQVQKQYAVIIEAERNRYLTILTELKEKKDALSQGLSQQLEQIKMKYEPIIQEEKESYRRLLTQLLAQKEALLEQCKSLIS
ncbi:MAG: hypothetical protein AABZ14_09310, partial [Candidatus Margulisiibacteriota bacterium]